MDTWLSRGKRLWAVVRAHRGRIIYYGGVAIMLTAIAVAADRYRVEMPTPQERLILPAIEMEDEPAETESAFRLPEGMHCIRAFHASPAWNAQLQLWEAHAANDYICLNDEVRAVCGGVVRTVGRSGIYGGFIEIEGDEGVFRYASVAPEGALVPGMSVSAGDCIGIADQSMPGERVSGAHLHLEWLKDGVSLDFEAEALENRAAVD